MAAPSRSTGSGDAPLGAAPSVSGSSGAPVSGAVPFAVVADAPRSDDAALVARLHADLTAAHFTVDRVTDLLGEEAMSAWSRDQAVPARRSLRHRGAGDPALSALVAFFLLGDPVRRSALDAALPAVGSHGLDRLGLVEPSSGQPTDGDPELRAAMDLRPYATDSSEELYVASDLGAFQRPGVLRRDHVLGIGGASTTLVQSTPRRSVERALDLGTGCGIQTFHLLAHAAHVTATDISDRALATTRFNLVLNAAALGLDPQRPEQRVRLVSGSLLEPVAGEHFDMVVSNPPFVITPRSATERAEDRFTYRDGGLPGDRIVRELLATLPSVLNPGGTAHLLANWEIPRDPQEAPETTWAHGPDSWIPRDTGAWIIQRELQDPCEYAETWLQDASQQRDPQAFDRAYAAYLDDFASRDVVAVGFGMVWLQRPAGATPEGGAASSAPPRVFETVPHPIQQPIAPALAAEWERTVRLAQGSATAAGHDDAAAPGATAEAPERDSAGTNRTWLDRCCTVAPDVTEERHGSPGAEDPSLILLRQGAGLRRTVILSSEAAGFAGVCDGELTARQILTALGALLSWPEGPSTQLLAEIEGLVVHGFLLEVQD